MAKAKSTTATKPKSSPSKGLVAIVPVEGRWLTGVPAVAQTLPAGEAKALIATGAFVEGRANAKAPADTELAASEAAASAFIEGDADTEPPADTAADETAAAPDAPPAKQ